MLASKDSSLLSAPNFHDRLESASLSPPSLEDEMYNLSSLFHIFAFNVLEKAVVSLFSFVFFRLNINYLLYRMTLSPGILTSWPPSSGHAC